MSSNPSLGWQKLQDVYYCLRPCYESLNWSIENLYSNYRVALSANTTLIALASKGVAYPNVIDIFSLSGNKILSVVYNSTATDHIIDFGFRHEELCVVLNNQKFRYYQDFKGNFNEHYYSKDLIFLDDSSSSNPLKDSKIQNNSTTGDYMPQSQYITNLENDETEEIFQVLEVKVWGEYLVLKLSNRFIITNLDTLVNYQIPFANQLASKIHCMNPLSMDNESLTILVSFDKTIISMKVDFSLSSYEIIDHGLTEGPFTQLTASPNGSLIALFNSSVERIFVINNKFDQVLLEYDTSNESSSPYQVEWCANDAIILSLKDELKLIGPGQKSISFFYDIIEEEDFDIESLSRVHDEDEFAFTIPILKTEPDGLKVITTKRVEFLSRVPEVSINLYQIGSSHPSSILLDCMDNLSHHSSKSDTSISLLKSDNSLLLGIEDCLKASLHEFNSFWQKKLLKAASFGKGYYDYYYNADDYLQTLNYHKVLNQLRSAELGIFLTYSEVLDIDWDELIQMLLRRDLHLLALKVIDLLGLQNFTDKVYIHWCCYKIRKELNMSDLELYKIISMKLISATGTTNKNSQNYISMEKISDVAYEEGRISLCKLLINLSPSVVKKINQFLKFGEFELALIKSFQSGDYDLCRLLLLKLHHQVSVSQFFKILNQNEQKGLITDTSKLELGDEHISHEYLFISGDLIGNFWVEAIGKFDEYSLEKFYKQEDRRLELSTFKFKSYILNLKQERKSGPYYDTYKSKLSKLTTRSTNRRNIKIYQRELEILELQNRLSETYQTDFFAVTSLNSILTKLIKMHQLKPALKVVKELKVSQEKFWYLVLDVYAKLNEFEKLYDFIASKSGTPSDKSNLRSPIGFKPIIETCIVYNGPKDQISIYIDNCTNIHYSERIEMYVNNEDLISAANEAFKSKDIEILKMIQKKATELGAGNDNIVNIVKNYITRLGF